MVARARLLCYVVAVAAAVVAPSAARAATCPGAACLTISGVVRGPAGEPVPSYNVLVQNADGVNVTVQTNASGRYEASVPPPSPGKCYQIAGLADAFYANATTGVKQCASATVDLLAKVRIQSVAGQQKTYLPDASAPQSLPIEISALSRSFPAPFDGQALPWVLEHFDPGTDELEGPENVDEHLLVHEHWLHHGRAGVFGAPSVRSIATGVWQYKWTTTLALDEGPGYYDMDWGRGTSVFEPMMECKMVWFGFGVDSLSPAKALPGATVTLSGRRLGATAGKVVLKGSGQVTTITGSAIVDWSDTSVTFVVPATAKPGWASIVSASHVASNAQYLELDPVKVLTS